MRASRRAVLVSWCLLACSAASASARPTPVASLGAPSDGASPSEPATPSELVTPSATATPADADTEADVRERARAFADAYRAMQAGRRDEARRGFAASVESLPELADHALFHQGHLALEDGDVEGARAALGRLLEEHPDSVWRDAAAVDRGRLALRDGDPAAAVAWFTRARDASDPETARAAKLGLAEARVALGDVAGAYALLDELRGTGRATGERARVRAEELERRGAAALGLTPAELRLRMARARLREGRPQEAREVLALLREGHPLRAEAALVVARSWGKENPAEASAAYQIAIGSSRASDVAGTALFERARLAWNRDQDAAADRDFATLLERFPAHPSADEALYARARIAEARGDTTTAITLYEQVAARFPQSKLAQDCLWQAAFVRYQRGEYADAARAFAVLGARDDARYWHARALEASGDRDGARAAFAALREAAPASYVAWWIDERIGPLERPPAYPRAVEKPLQPAPPLGGAAAYHWTRGQILNAIGLRRDAARELQAVEALTGPDAFLAPAYREAGAWASLVRLGLRLQQAGRPGQESAIYPRPYPRDFEAGAARAGVDPLLLVSMARQESLFDPLAVSPVGARGVLQLMPATAARVAGAEVETRALHEPSFNIDLGARYLGELLRRFDGRIVLAVAAYNAGPEAVERWLARFPDVGVDEFVERITYRETRGYVKAVLRNYRTYHLLYGDGALPRPRLY